MTGKQKTTVLVVGILALSLVCVCGLGVFVQTSVIDPAMPSATTAIAKESKTPLLPPPTTVPSVGKSSVVDRATSTAERNGLSFWREDSFGENGCEEDACIFYGQSDGAFMGLYVTDGQLTGFGTYVYDDSDIDGIVSASVEILILDLGMSDSTMDCVTDGVSQTGFSFCGDVVVNVIPDADGLMSLFVLQ
jgi:hypothetical protein